MGVVERRMREKIQIGLAFLLLSPPFRYCHYSLNEENIVEVTKKEKKVIC
jgi:hypothetical protein